MAIDQDNITDEQLFNLTDEEISNLSTAEIEKFSAQPDDQDDLDKDDEADKDADDLEDDDQSEADEDSEDESESDDEESEADTSEEDSSESSEDDTSADDSESDDTDEDEESKPDDDGKDTFDYKAAYEQITASFKANGTEFKIKSPDEAIKLMQQGANYGKKMVAIKPHLRTARTLEKNGVTTDDELNYLLDLKNKKPEAIQKLIKESGIDPLSLEEDSGAYTPGDYTPTPEEAALDDALESIKDTPTYSQLLNVVGKQWDVASKNVIGQQPQIINLINDHLASGIYDVINTEMQRQRTLGNLNGLNDLDAYKQIGDSIQAAGGFNHLSPRQGNQNPAVKKLLPSKSKAEDDKLNQKRKAASTSKKAKPSKTSPADFNPLNMSDEDFMKLQN
jgi:hypothetical protein